MKISVISCKVLQREICYLCANSKNIATPTFLPQGLHNTPQKLKKYLQAKIDEISKEEHEWEIEKPDAIVLGYGLCSNGVTGLVAHDIPIVVPRTDDCIGIFLGSQKRYLKHFNEESGIYWYNPGWIETSFMPSEENYLMQKERYTELYGEDNAEFLMEETNGWHTKYSAGIYITSPIVDNSKYIEYTEKSMEFLKWEFKTLDGDMSLLENLIDGNWNEEDFLVCPPHHKITETYDKRKIQAVPV